MTGSQPAPPPLRNDCFALPPGVDWTPVDTALDRLRQSLTPLTAIETIDTGQALGRVLAEAPVAQIPHPPFANAAVDGYGFAHGTVAAGTGDGTCRLPLVAGRAAAGAGFAGAVPPGHALRILTGARLPGGVDTIVLEEDTRIEDGTVRFSTGLRKAANTRPMGEDFQIAAPVLPPGRRITSGDLALLATAGIARIAVRERLRVAILSTGDELVPLGQPRKTGQITDANRPMLAGLLGRWGFDCLDLGALPDDPALIRRALDQGADEAHAILTTGGASAGDEDHISALLRSAGQLTTWRIALKPGRPLALALWNGVPVFGLPGNPVAAFVCSLIFARPALLALAGAPWETPLGFPLQARFAKSKKPGRSEFLRARRADAASVDVFASEGSGRVSGLSFADGLIALGPEARTIAEGDPVTYIPFSEFGL